MSRVERLCRPGTNPSGPFFILLQVLYQKVWSTFWLLVTFAKPKGMEYLLVMFPGMNGIDPSKLSPQVIAEITSLMQTLSPDQIMKMQTLMHNAMAGMNVTAEMADFEKGLPPTFRERMARIQYMANGVDLPPKTGMSAATSHDAIDVTPMAAPQNENEARLVILKSVAQGLMSPENALKVLFPESL